MAALAAIPLTTACSPSQQHAPAADLGIEPGLVITVDSEGFNLPTAIAVAPQPSGGPDDPIYYVTELRRKTKESANRSSG